MLHVNGLLHSLALDISGFDKDLGTESKILEHSPNFSVYGELKLSFCDHC